MLRITIEDLNSSPEEIFRLRELLGNGGVAAVPTETYYALAADPRNDTAIRRILRAKGRDAAKPLSVLFSRRQHLERLGVSAPAATIDYYLEIWPAPLTVVFPIREPIAASRGQSTLGVRLPAASKLRIFLDAVGAVTGTSLNRSGSPPVDNPNTVEALFRREVDILVDGGKTPGGKPSTVLDATRQPPVVLRPGAFVWAGP
jgi:L-threonylcarbamoyladenylate synthase